MPEIIALGTALKPRQWLLMYMRASTAAHNPAANQISRTIARGNLLLFAKHCPIRSIADASARAYHGLLTLERTPDDQRHA